MAPVVKFISLSRLLKSRLVFLIPAMAPLVFVEVDVVRHLLPGAANRPVPAERIFWHPPAAGGQAPATLHIVRDYRFRGSALPLTVTIDGQAAVSIGSGENVMLHVPPGTRSIALIYRGQQAQAPASTASTRALLHSGLTVDLSGGKYHQINITTTNDREWRLAPGES